MKKLGVVIAALLAVGGAAWVGSSWYIGKETEKLVRAQIDQANQQLAVRGVRQELVSYDSSLLGAKAVTRLQVTEPVIAEWLNNVQFTHTIKNGPVLFANGVSLGVSHWDSRLDTSSLPEKTKAFVDKAFAGGEPLVATTKIGFDQVLHTQMTINPMDARLEESNGTLKLAGVTLTADISAKDKSGPFIITADKFEWRDQNASLAIPSLQAEGQAGAVAGGLENFTAKAPEITILAAGETAPLKMDLTMQSSTTEQNGSIQGNGSFQLANIQGPHALVKQADIKVDYAGFKLDGLKDIQALQAKLQALQEQMQVDEVATELPEGQKQQQQLGQQAQQVTEELLDVILNKVLQAGESKLRYDLNLDLGNGKVTSVTDLTYAGSSQPIKLNDLMLYGPKDWGRLVKGSVDLSADKTAVPEDLGMLLSYPLAQKSIVEANNQYKLQLKLLGETAELNGSPVEFADLPAKFFPQMPSLGAKNDLGIPPDLMKQIEEQGMTPEIMQQLEESDDVPKETLQMLKQLQQMNTQAPQ